MDQHAQTIPMAKTRRVLGWLLLLLVSGYIIFNRTFAKLGWPPIYVGEIVLGVCLVAMLFDFKRAFVLPLKHSRAMQMVAMFALAGFVRIAIDFPSKGLDAARDGVICIYALYAFVASWLKRDVTSEVLWDALSIISLFAWIFAATILSGTIAAPADIKVDFLTLSVALAFAIWSYTVACMWRLSITVHGTRVLYGVFLAVAMLITLFRLPTRALWPAPLVFGGVWLLSWGLNRKAAVIAACILAAVMGVSALAVPHIPSIRERIDAVFDPDETHFKTPEGQRAAHSVKWRAVFWKRCVNQTLERAPVFGLGFGSNLTALLRGTPEWPMFEDSQNAAKYGSPNRSPHCAHVTVFTRMGAVGLLLWLGALGTIFARGLKNCWAARAALPLKPTGEWWNGVVPPFLSETLLLGCWSIYVLAMTFGVVLENPFGGIPFWVLTGMLAQKREFIRIPAQPRPTSSASPATAASAQSGS